MTTLPKAVFRTALEGAYNDAGISKLEARLEAADQQIAALKSGMAALDHLLRPELTRFLRNMSGGAICSADDQDWRFSGFYDCEYGNAGLPFRWSRRESDCTILFFLIENEAYRGKIKAITPDRILADALIVAIDDAPQTFTPKTSKDGVEFNFTATRSGWHKIALAAPQVQPADNSADIRELGFIFQSAEMLPLAEIKR
jgi:hypothetical protein